LQQALNPFDLDAFYMYNIISVPVAKGECSASDDTGEPLVPSFKHYIFSEPLNLSNSTMSSTAHWQLFSVDHTKTEK